MQGKTVDFRAAILELVEGNVRFVLLELLDLQQFLRDEAQREGAESG